MNKKVRVVERIVDFTEERNLYLQTADYRLFIDPYGDICPGAVGKIYRLTGCCGPGFGEIPLGYVKKIKPKLPDGENVPIIVTSQRVDEKEKVVVLKAEVRYGNHWTMRKSGDIPDGVKIELELYSDTCTFPEIIES
jgi:hypothetical protein